MFKNYYLILGVPIDAAPPAIRSAFRELAKRYHPDHGTHDASGFQEVHEAYEVLSDPERRAKYDRTLRGTRPPRRTGRGAEPLVSEPMAATGRPERVSPSLESLLERFARNFTLEHVPKSEHAEPLNFELILDPDEAARGVTIPFEVPVFQVCHWCGGTGHEVVGVCERCDGEGRLADRRGLDVRVPAGVRAGAVLEVSLADLGVTNLWLRVHVRVARH